MSKRGAIFGPCKNWGQKSTVVHGTRQYKLEEVTGWQKEPAFINAGGMRILQEAIERSKEKVAAGGVSQGEMDVAATDGIEYIDTTTEEGAKKAFGILTQVAGGEGYWCQEEEETRDREETPCPEASSGVLEAFVQLVGEAAGSDMEDLE